MAARSSRYGRVRALRQVGRFGLSALRALSLNPAQSWPQKQKQRGESAAEAVAGQLIMRAVVWIAPGASYALIFLSALAFVTGLWHGALAQGLPVGPRVSATPERIYMPVGKNVLAPTRFVQFCVQKPARCAPSETQNLIIFKDRRSELQKIQIQVNRAIAPVEHTQQFRPWDDNVTEGECYNYGLAKRSVLLDLGYPSSALLLATAITPDEKPHLVLIVETDEGDFVLDNLRWSVIRWDKLAYHWIERSKPNNPLFWQEIASS